MLSLQMLNDEYINKLLMCTFIFSYTVLLFVEMNESLGKLTNPKMHMQIGL